MTSTAGYRNILGNEAMHFNRELSFPSMLTQIRCGRVVESQVLFGGPVIISLRCPWVNNIEATTR